MVKPKIMKLQLLYFLLKKDLSPIKLKFVPNKDEDGRYTLGYQHSPSWYKHQIDFKNGYCLSYRDWEYKCIEGYVQETRYFKQKKKTKKYVYF